METFNDDNQDSVTPILDSRAEENTVEKMDERNNDDDNARKDTKMEKYNFQRKARTCI